tara:strand:- start:725 stop:1387 length:663 start_codon:yes stop_codon:yes gene_type:complete
MNVRRNRVVDPNSAQLRQQIQQKTQNRQQVANSVQNNVNSNQVLEWHEKRLINLKADNEKILKTTDEVKQMMAENNKINSRNEQLINACTNNLNLVEKQMFDKIEKSENKRKDLETFVNELDLKNKALLSENTTMKALLKTVQQQFELFRDETNVRIFKMEEEIKKKASTNNVEESLEPGEDVSRSVVKTVKKLKGVVDRLRKDIEGMKSNNVQLEIREQ